MSSSVNRNNNTSGGRTTPAAAGSSSTNIGKAAATTTTRTGSAGSAGGSGGGGILSTSALEQKLRKLREDSQRHSQVLTQKLASSQSGQNLLHIGTSLSTLPPDLHSLLTQLHPLLASAEQAESDKLRELTRVVQAAKAVRVEQRRGGQARSAADLYADLVAAERDVRRRRQRRSRQASPRGRREERLLQNLLRQEEEEEDDGDDEAGGGETSEGDDDRDEVPGGDDVAGGGAGDAKELDRGASLERDAHITLCLVQELHAATETVSALTTAAGPSGVTASAADATTGTVAGDSSAAANAAAATTTPTNGSGGGAMLPTMRRLEPDSEKAQFVLRLAPRIRRLESDTLQCLGHETEAVLQRLQRLHEEEEEEVAENDDVTSDNDNHQSSPRRRQHQQQEHLLFLLGHAMRGTVLLGRGKDVESAFARVAIMPLVRNRVSMGRLDEGGSRGECAGLVSLLEEMLVSIHRTFGPVLRTAETMFRVESCSSSNSGTAGGSQQQAKMDVDLITAGVWVPIATALMADAGIKMAIFSPGIASILQVNYTALDRFLAQLASRLLQEDNDDESEKTRLSSTAENWTDGSSGRGQLRASDLYYRPSVSARQIQEAQERIYYHPKTAEFSKKWNLPIYYQLRFGECCSRLNKAVDQTKREGWIAEVFTGSEVEANQIKHEVGFELSLFLELYDILLGLWRPDVVLRPLTNRFLRGAVQLIGRVLAFVSDGMEGTIKFGEEPPQQTNGATAENGDGTAALPPPPQPAFPTRSPYCWSDSEQDVAAVAWELTILDSTVRHDYVDNVCKALHTDSGTEADDKKEVRSLVSDMLKDASDQIHPLIDKAWNHHVVKILTSKCSAPLSAVKGVAATYRMTNRPPPTQASPFVGTILRPLKEFSKDFENRTPDRVGSRWKHQVVVTIADRYAVAVEELLATVQRTELALNSRRARRTASGGMRDGEKVKLQLYLDYEMFSESVRDVGVDPATVIGLSKLRDLTAEGVGFMKRTAAPTTPNENGS